jgi:hypothetical protein
LPRAPFDFRRVLSSFAQAAVLIAFVASACGRSRALSPAESPVGAAGENATGSADATSTGAAGASASGLAGGGGAMSAASGSAGTGAAGFAADGAAGTSASTPLRISAGEALDRVAAVLWRLKRDPNELSPTAAFTTRGDVALAVRSMLSDPRAQAGVGAFYRWWLDLDSVATLAKDPMLFPEATPQLLSDMADETTAFGIDLTLAHNGSMDQLFTANWTFVNAGLASIYGVVGGVLGDPLRFTMLPPGRAGLLTQPALQALGSLAKRNSPSHRGTYIDQRMLCEDLPSAPVGIPGLDPIPPGESVRQALAADLGGAACAACHTAIDPPGLAFEGFDAIGRARTTDNGAPIDTSNLAVRMPDPTGSTNGTSFVVEGPVELAKLLSTAPAVEGCFAQKWLSFVLGRDLEPGDMPSLASAQQAFAASGFNIQTLIAAVLSSDTFLAPL